MLIGYARISTTEQDLDLQRDALHKAGCDEIFTDNVSGTKEDLDRNRHSPTFGLVTRLFLATGQTGQITLASD